MKTSLFMKFILAFVLIVGITVPFANTTDATKISYLKDTKKVYHYGNRTFTFYAKEEGFNFWGYSTPTFEDEYFEKETSKGLYIYGEKALAYPIKKGKSWSTEDGKRKIHSTNNIVKTPAGTFKGVVIVEVKIDDEKTYEYYAPSVGLIMGKYMSLKEKPDLELTKLVNKK